MELDDWSNVNRKLRHGHLYGVEHDMRLIEFDGEC